MSAFAKFLTSPEPGEEVVISGISGKFPGTNDMCELKDNLFTKKDMVEDLTKRWDFVSEVMPHRGGTINNIDKFDAGFFGIHGRQAKHMDTMIRVFLETAVEAIFDAGLNPKELEGTRTGVYVAAAWEDSSSLIDSYEPQRMGMTGYMKFFVANRLAYFLKLKGPCCVADTACSSSLHAFETAFKDIRSGKCDRALVGGSHLTLYSGTTLQFYRLGVLSLDGRCKVFDEKADGYARSETISCILLEKAKDSKRIYVQVVHSKCNSDGYKEDGITFPSAVMQSVLMKEVYEESGVHPNDLCYIEGHCTGTRVGDPEEVEAIDNVIGKRRNKPLLIGSVKSNLGHAEPCSGLCSIAKIIIALETGLVPPNINLNTVKKGLTGVEEKRLKPVVDLTPIDDDDKYLGLNNFGFGGSNCHVVFKGMSRKRDVNQIHDTKPRLVCVSGRTKAAVVKIFDDLGQREMNFEYIRLLHDIFRFDIKSHIYRGFAVVSDKKIIKTSVSGACNKPDPLSVYFGVLGQNYKIIGKSFLNITPFENSLREFNKELRKKKLDIFDIIMGDKNDSLCDILGSVAVQIAFGDVLKAAKLEPASTKAESWGKLSLLQYQGKLTIKEVVDAIFEIKSSQELDKMCNNTKNGKSTLILDVSNSQSVEEIIGKLYESGYNPQIQNLYPEVKFPVSRGTPMISPLISWNHSKSWPIASKCDDLDESNLGSFQTEVTYNPLKYEHSFIQGHVIDGRNLFPATGYLYIVWKALANNRRLGTNSIGVVFEDVQFLTATTFPKTGYLSLILSVSMDCDFEISQDGVVAVKGRAFLSENCKESSKLQVGDFDENDSSLVMDKEDFYKELQLRGYNYSGLFQSVVKVNIDATSGLVKWEENWIAFMDNMLQLKILQYDTRNLYVPTGIKRCVINSLKQTYGTNDEIPVTVYKDVNLIKCKGVEIYGLEAKAIARKKQVNDPILEKYVFVPNSGDLSLEDSLKVNVQVILENTTESNIKALELTNGTSDDCAEILLPKIRNILEGIPLINSDFVVCSKRKAEDFGDDLESIKVEDVLLTQENSYLLIVGSKKMASIKQVLACLNKGSFLLIRDQDFTPGDVDGAKILTVHRVGNEKLVLLRKTDASCEYLTLEVRSDDFEWLTQLQKALQVKTRRKVVIYSQNETVSGILGLINCVLRENGGDRVKCFFILDDAPKFDIDNALYRTQLEKDFSINVYKNGKWGTYRHLLLDEIAATDNEHCLINNTVKGDLSSLKWLHGKLTAESNNIVKVHYAALNFKDVMIATGRISADVFVSSRLEQESILGFEYSGVTLSGKRIMGILEKEALSTLVEADSTFTWHVPQDWTLEKAATVPTVYATVIYGLLIRAQLKRGMSILIHSGTGGIGLSAINVCSYYGCEIFVTVGTEEKREFLKKHFPHISDDHIGNSRDTSFEQMIEKQTNGRGVDIVLNSLAEEKLLASVRCLANGGNFVEIGKFDLSQNNPLSLLLFEKGASFHGVMLDVLFKEQTPVREILMNEMVTGLKLGYVKPLPVNTFSHDEVEAAFRFLTTGKHIGKVVVKIREHDKDSRKFIVKGFPKVICDNFKTYIIIGGLGGYGLELADWLVTRGVRKLILSSRQGVRNGYQLKRIRIWESYGVCVRISTSDVTTREGCLNLIKEAEDLGAVEGIFNLGVVLKDAAFENQTESDFEISFGPKAFATKFLDDITRKSCHDLRYFVVFSSISCGRGNAGQTNYGMANSVMERICENRRKDGLPGIAIEWGAIGDVGLVAQLAKSNIELEIRGTLQQRISNCLEILDRLLTQTESAIVSSMVVASKKKSYGSGTALDAVLRILGISDVNTVSRQATLAELGMDSITATEIVRVLETDFDIFLSVKDIRAMTFEQIVEAEKSGAERKSELFEERMITFMPEGHISSEPFTKMISKIDKNNLVFVLPGFEGSLISMEPITENLNTTCYGLKYNFAGANMNIEEMARYFLPHIENLILRKNTFNIICHSFGGVLGVEIACLLESKGYLGKIFAVDSGVKYAFESIDKIHNVESDTEFETTYLSNVLALFIPIDLVAPHKEKLKGFATFKERINHAYSIAVENVKKQELLSHFEQRVSFTYNRLKAAHSYRFSHEKLRSAVYLFKASNPMVPMSEEDYGWSQICQGSIDINVIDGNHASILDSKELVHKINEIVHK